MAKKNTALAVKNARPTDLALPMEDWEKELLEKANAERAKETLGVPRITHDNGAIKIDGKPVKDNKLQFAVIDYIFTKAYFVGKYVKGKPSTPVCYAYGREESGMVPHEAAPEKVCDACNGCEWNRFFTAEQGKGKRCKDERRVMCIVQVDDPESIAGAEVRQFSIPPGSLKNWGKYLNQIREVTPTGNVRAVLTEMSTEDGAAGAYVLTFKPVAKLAKEQVQAIIARTSSVEPALFAPWPKLEAPAEAQRNPKAGAKARK